MRKQSRTNGQIKKTGKKQEIPSGYVNPAEVSQLKNESSTEDFIHCALCWSHLKAGVRDRGSDLYVEMRVVEMF